jgi:hypothetical protein
MGANIGNLFGKIADFAHSTTNKIKRTTSSLILYFKIFATLDFKIKIALYGSTLYFIPVLSYSALQEGQNFGYVFLSVKPSEIAFFLEPCFLPLGVVAGILFD